MLTGPRQSTGSATGRMLMLLSILLLIPGAYAFATDTGGHADPVASLLLALILILSTAKLGGALFEGFGQPAVLGELVGGVLLGNLVLLNPEWSFFEPLRVAELTEHWAVTVNSLAGIGVIILLFEVGLESTVHGMMKVGASSLLVATLGVIAPMVLGFGVSWLFITELPAQLVGVVPPDFSLNYIHLFIGAVLCATSVGITARVLKDIGKLQSKEGQIIVGAAVIDDVLGLVVLAVISGLVAGAEAGRPLDVGGLFRLIAIAVLFLGGSLAVGVFLVPRIMNQLSRVRTHGMMLVSALLFAFLFSYLANAAGLATIVGAFAAGLILEEVHFRGFREDVPVMKVLQPISAFLVPIFFVLMGIQVRLETFAELEILGVAAGLTAAAIVGKQVCGLGVLEKGLDRLTVGVGMIPRGEVGLIFAAIGKSLRVIDDATFSAVVIMVVVTTLITPPLLKVTLTRWEQRKGKPS